MMNTRNKDARPGRRGDLACGLGREPWRQVKLYRRRTDLNSVRVEWLRNVSHTTSLGASDGRFLAEDYNEHG